MSKWCVITEETIRYPVLIIAIKIFVHQSLVRLLNSSKENSHVILVSSLDGSLFHSFLDSL